MNLASFDRIFWCSFLKYFEEFWSVLTSALESRKLRGHDGIAIFINL